MINGFQSYRFLSNFWSVSIEIDGKAYSSVEHYYQACKARTTEDHEQIRNARTPGEAKRLGGKTDIIDQWDQKKVWIMMRGLRAKFSNLELARKLFDTGDEFLVEWNYWGDRFWGVSDYVGYNLLGQLLMMVREEVKERMTSPILLQRSV